MKIYASEGDDITEPSVKLSLCNNETLVCFFFPYSPFYDVVVNHDTVKTLNIGTPRPATVVVLNMKQFNFTMK